MLKTAKPILEKDINNLIVNGSTNNRDNRKEPIDFYDIIYQTKVECDSPKDPAMGIVGETGRVVHKSELELLTSQEKLSYIESDAYEKQQKIIKENANEFAELITNKFMEKITPGLSDAIYNFVKEIGISIINTPTTLTSPMGPVSGLITIKQPDITIG